MIIFLIFLLILHSLCYENFEFKLTQSTPTVRLWTTVPTKKVMKNDAIPTDTGDTINVYSAKNEFEPFLLVINPVSDYAPKIELPKFSNNLIEVKFFQAVYTRITKKSDNLGCDNCDWADALWPVEDLGTLDSITANENGYIWVLIKVPPQGVNGGDYSGTIKVDAISVNIKLHVFNFGLSSSLHIKSQMNFNFQSVLSKYSVSGTGSNYWKYVDNLKKFWMDHRMTPKSALWPCGVNANDNYDCTTQKISDPHGIWGYESEEEKCLKKGINGTVFPSYMFMTFQNNDPSQDQRPSSFCGESRSSDDFLEPVVNYLSPYNQKWFSYIKALQVYFEERDVIDINYYYAWNEPQNQDDYDSIAWYSSVIKAEFVAPKMKLMVSEEPRKEIFANEKYPWSKIDIWLPVLNNFQPAISYSRAAYCHESTWVYFLHGTVPPYLNPLTIDHPGVEAKLLGTLLWKYRIDGIAYYSCNDWSSNPYTNPAGDGGQNGNKFLLYPPSKSNGNIPYGSNNHRFVPSIRFELMRDGLEDYEYLYMVNKGKPTVENQGTEADKLSEKLVLSLDSYLRDDQFLYNFRRDLGYYIGGEKGITMNYLLNLTGSPPHSRGNGSPKNYYINFQDPSGQPTASPLIVNGKNWSKIGWSDYSNKYGFGWYGWMEQVKYQYLSNAGSSNELQKSIIYCDYGRPKTFNYVVPNGCYDVTVSVGWYNKKYEDNYIVVNNVMFFDDVNNNGGYLTAKHEICVTNYLISMNMGLFDKYTMLNYLMIEANGKVPPKPSFTTVSYSEPPTTDLYCSLKDMKIDSSSGSNESFLFGTIFVYFFFLFFHL